MDKRKILLALTAGGIIATYLATRKAEVSPPQPPPQPSVKPAIEFRMDRTVWEEGQSTYAYITLNKDLGFGKSLINVSVITKDGAAVNDNPATYMKPPEKYPYTYKLRIGSPHYETVAGTKAIVGLMPGTWELYGSVSWTGGEVRDGPIKVTVKEADILRITSHDEHFIKEGNEIIKADFHITYEPVKKPIYVTWVWWYKHPFGGKLFAGAGLFRIDPNTTEMYIHAKGNKVLATDQIIEYRHGGQKYTYTVKP